MSPRWRGRLPRTIAAVVLLLLLAPGHASADKRYDANRFDVRISLQADGTTRVTETVEFRFEGGTFTQVTRELPLRRTDGIQVLGADLDGEAVAIGRDAGDRRLEVSRRENRVRAAWRFPPLDGTHTFSLSYVVRGLVQAGDGEDLLAWTVLPRDHDYRIAASRVTFEWPGAALLRSVTADGRPVDVGSQSASFELRGLGRDDSVTLRAAFAPGTAAPRPAGWQQREARRREMAPTWSTLAVSLFVVASALFFFAWIRSPRPTGREAFADTVPHQPGAMSPAMAGALTAGGGGPSTRHTIAAVLDLARRGLLRIEERPKGRWGSRQFIVRREAARGAHAALRPHEQAILDTVFTKKGQTEDEVEMSAVHGRLTSGSGRITRAVRQELSEAGLLDADRLRARRRLMTAATVVMVVGFVGILLTIPLAPEYGGWPVLVPLALEAASAIGFILAASLPAQSDAGLRQGARWQRYGAHLQQASRKGETASPISPDALPFAVAFGAAAAYAKALRERGMPLPAWFHPASLAPDEQGAAFVALMTTSAASGSASAGGAGGGAAGGGSSGAS